MRTVKGFLSLATGAVILMLAQAASAAVVSRNFGGCPNNGLNILDSSGPSINVSDVIITSTADQFVTLKFQGGVVLFRARVKAGETVSHSFRGPVFGPSGGGIRLDCSGENATVSVTIVGQSEFNL